MDTIMRMLTDHMDFQFYWKLEGNICRFLEDNQRIIRADTLITTQLDRVMLHNQRIMSKEIRCYVQENNLEVCKKVCRVLSNVLSVVSLNMSKKFEDHVTELAQYVSTRLSNIANESNMDCNMVQNDLQAVIPSLCTLSHHLKGNSDPDLYNKFNECFNEIKLNEFYAIENVAQVIVVNKKDNWSKYKPKLIIPDHDSHLIETRARAMQTMALFNLSCVRSIHVIDDVNFIKEAMSDHENNREQSYLDELLKHQKTSFTSFCTAVVSDVVQSAKKRTEVEQKSKSRGAQTKEPTPKPVKIPRRVTVFVQGVIKYLDKKDAPVSFKDIIKDLRNQLKLKKADSYYEKQIKNEVEHDESRLLLVDDVYKLCGKEYPEKNPEKKKRKRDHSNKISSHGAKRRKN
ncbi:hypothetical protein AKO1_010271 [Acrasis kona]|uniref:Uncharacterized protein n=1 Tax=Acrasis kona TaxID=1008807 RepID=A0AAW2ZQV7_9EUKA